MCCCATNAPLSDSQWRISCNQLHFCFFHRGFFWLDVTRGGFWGGCGKDPKFERENNPARQTRLMHSIRAESLNICRWFHRGIPTRCTLNATSNSTSTKKLRASRNSATKFSVLLRFPGIACARRFKGIQLGVKSSCGNFNIARQEKSHDEYLFLHWREDLLFTTLSCRSMLCCVLSRLCGNQEVISTT